MQNDYSYTQNRELSWLKFDRRCLYEAVDETVPLFEKLKFLQIFCSNLDEFNMVRVGSLTDLSLLKNQGIDNKSGLSPQEQLDKIFESMKELYKEKDRVFELVEQEFRKNGVYNLNIDELTKAQKKAAYKYYKEYILPVLTPQIIGFEHPLPFLQNLNEYILVEFEKQDGIEFGIMPIPNILPKIIKLSSDSGQPFIRTSKVITEFVEESFPKYKILKTTGIRVTRNADLSADDEIAYDEVDYRSHMKKILKKRNRLQTVRVEVNTQISPAIEKLICEGLDITPKQIFLSESPLSMDFVSELKNYLSKEFITEHSYSSYFPNSAAKLGFTGNVIEKVKKKDYLLSYPYDSMDPFLKLIEQAVSDPRVVSIKITIYRLAKNSRLVKLLCAAAEAGKEVLCLMELRARFDEQNNLDYSKELYDAGCQIIYGMAGFKVHSKICLITFNDNNKWSYITQIGTGNYNEITSGIYTDFSLLTGNKEIGEDAVEFFKNLSVGNLNGSYKHLLQSPSTLKIGLLEKIDEEIKKGEEGRLFFKMNSLTDRDFIDKLAEASQAGVKIKMIIRGISSLVPEIPGKTENIEIISIVGRMLEHSRVYIFGKEQKEIYIGSADLMTRNTTRRVELLTPILDENIRKRIINYMDIEFKDNVKARKFDNKGNLVFRELEGEKFNAQEYFMQEAVKVEEEVKKESVFSKLFSKIFKK